MNRSRALGLLVLVSSCIGVASACSDSDKTTVRGGDAGEPSAGVGGEAATEGGAAQGGTGASGGRGDQGGSADGGSAEGGSSAGSPEGSAGSPEGGASAGGATENAGGSADAGAGGASEPCSGPARCSSDEVAAICLETGELLTLECTNGCEAGACLQSDLEQGWVLHQYALTDGSSQTLASYSFSEGGLSALQTQNAEPSIYYLDKELENVVIRGSFGVQTTADDDLIGFVFGMQDTEHYYLFDWKQAGQPDAQCGEAAIGASLKLVSADAPLEGCTDFWSSIADTASMKVLVPPSENPTGWVDNQIYDFELRHRPGQISIRVTLGQQTVVDISSSDTTYGRGRFGFYNYSQEQTRYQFFDIQPAG